jgi:hypothetical protein
MGLCRSESKNKACGHNFCCFECPYNGNKVCPTPRWRCFDSVAQYIKMQAEGYPKEACTILYAGELPEKK